MPLDPLQVAIVNQTDWWLPWLPVGGSGLLFVGAMLTLWLTNRAAKNRQEREIAEKRAENIADRVAAEERQFKQWRLDTLMKVCSEVTAAERNIDRLYNVQSVAQCSDSEFSANKAAVSVETRRLGTLADSLKILGFDDLEQRCRSIRDAVWRIAGPAARYRRESTAKEPVKEKVSASDSARKAAIEEMNKARRKFVERAQFDLKKTAAQAH